MARVRTRRRRKNRILPALIVLILFIALVVGAIQLSVSWVRDYAGDPLGVNESVEITVSEGAGAAEIAEILKDEGIINSPGFFRFASKLGGHDGDYKMGTYLLKKNPGYDEIFKVLSGNGESETVSITIPEGFELRQIADRLEEAGLIDREEFYNQVEYGDFDYDFVRAIPERENRLEGYLFPDTYFFEKTADEATIIDTMLRRFDEIYSKYAARAEERGFTVDEVVTLASIVEREAAGDVDRKDVSSVFNNRLESSEYPYLQSCATVQYVLGERKPVLSTEDTKIDSPYNTYIHKGLPIGPIASPGEASIEAALYPNDTDYLFFVATNSEGHKFARTYEEHLANMNR